MHLQDVEFAFVYPESLGGDLGSLRSVVDSSFYK
jgi:hypothetical protein